MKQIAEQGPINTSDFSPCNGHEDDSIKTRKDSENDDGSTSPSSPTATANDLILLPDSSFNVRIQSPGLETFELPVTSSELVQEIHQVLMDKEETCHRTCFSLQLDGNILDNFTELKNIENLKEGSLLKVIEG